MSNLARLGILAILFIVGLTFGAHAQNAPTDEEIANLLVAEKSPQIARQFGISQKDAEVATRILHYAAQSGENARKNPTQINKLHADFLKQLSLATLMHAQVLAEGELLIEEMRDGVPGTWVPKALSEKVNRWAWFAGLSLKVGMAADAKGIEYATTQATASEECKKMTFGCGQKLVKATNMIVAIGEHMRSQAKAVGVLTLTVKNLRY